MNIKNFKDLQSQVKSSPQIRQRLLDDPEKFISDLNPRNDRGIFLTVLYMVGAILFLTIGFSAWITFSAKDPSTASVPDYLITISSTALGALVGLLVPNNN